VSSASAWLQLARVSNTPTVVSNTVAGAVLASTAAEIGEVAVVAGSMALFYTAGMVLNDLLDFDVDVRERPERPLPSGAVSRPAALTAVIGLFAAGEALLLLAGTKPFLAGLGLIALIVLYDAWHKGNPLSPVLMGACRALVYFIAALAVTAEVPTDVAAAAAVLLLYVASLTLVAKLVRSGRIVAAMIAGIAIFDAVVVIIAGGGIAPVAVCLAAFLLTIALQTKIAGT
jgi:4-hydroxybenzoate polyprenyltransferase